MNAAPYRERFIRIFLMNVERRSRTAKGKDEGTKTSSDKLPLLLQGDALKAKVAENVSSLVADVYTDAARTVALGEPITASRLRLRCERWYDLVTAGLIDHAAYEPKYLDLERKAAKLGRSLTLNRRYRLWTPKYVVLQIPPALIDQELGESYVWLGLYLTAVASPGYATLAEVARIMAYADVAQDGEIHPWCDGCARVSTALIMWLAAIYRVTPPLFAPTKEEHLRTILDVEAHAAYLFACLRRAEAEVS